MPNPEKVVRIVDDLNSACRVLDFLGTYFDGLISDQYQHGVSVL